VLPVPFIKSKGVLTQVVGIKTPDPILLPGWFFSIHKLEKKSSLSPLMSPFSPPVSTPKYLVILDPAVNDIKTFNHPDNAALLRSYLVSLGEGHIMLQIAVHPLLRGSFRLQIIVQPQLTQRGSGFIGLLFGDTILRRHLDIDRYLQSASGDEA
jgi:hypothetical protein